MKNILKDEEVLDCQPLQEGMSSHVFQITTENEKYYLRIATQDYESYFLEKLAHEELLKRGVKVPKIKYFEEKNRQINRSILLTEEIKGEQVESQKNNLSNKEVSEILFSAGKDLAKIHSIPVTGYGPISREPGDKSLIADSTKYEDFVLWDINEAMELWRKHSDFTLKESDEILAIADTFRNLFKDTKPILAHGDFGLEHIYAEKGKYTGIIDFGDIRGASIYHDLANFLIYSNRESYELLLDGYGAINDPKRENKLLMESLFILIQNFRFRCDEGIEKKSGWMVEYVRKLLEELT